MGVLRESWCFCNGGGKSEKMKAAIFAGKSPAMVRVGGVSTGFLIHRNLLLTTHASLPSPAAAETAEIRLLSGASACLFPHRFFITSSVLDLTVVGIDVVEGDSNNHLHYLKSCSKANLELGSVVYLLGYSEKQELGVGEGKVAVATDNLIKLSTEGVIWSPGSAGFDSNGNLAFMVCDPMKLAKSPNTRSCSSSSSSPPSCKRDLSMQFGIPIPIILDWLNQHWEGNLDELCKPKLPLKRLMSKNELSCASFTMRRVFKPIEGENEGGPAFCDTISRTEDSSGPSFPVLNALEEEAVSVDRRHVSGIPTPEIYGSPELLSTLVGKKAAMAMAMAMAIPTRVQHLDVNSPASMLPKPGDASSSSSSSAKQSRKVLPRRREELSESCDGEPSGHAESTESVNRAQNDMRSTSSPADTSELPQGYNSEGETTMYSAETAESRNFPSPGPGKVHNVRRSQSCGNYPRWAPVQRCSVARGALPEKHRSFTPSRKVHSQGTASHDYFSPTVSSIMKKRNNMAWQIRPQQNAVHTCSPRWML